MTSNTIQHSETPEEYKHEPKGATDAVDRTVYIADGAGSGAFGELAIADLNYTPDTITDGTAEAVPVITELDSTLASVTDNKVDDAVFNATWSPSQLSTINKNFAEVVMKLDEQIVTNEKLTDNNTALLAKVNELLGIMRTAGLVS